VLSAFVPAAKTAPKKHKTVFDADLPHMAFPFVTTGASHLSVLKAERLMHRDAASRMINSDCFVPR
jgi:hypothetical protein